VDPHYLDEGERFIGPDGSSWHEVAEWLEPDEVASLVKRGALTAIDSCEEWEWDAPLTSEVMDQVVTSEESHRRAGVLRNSGEVILAPSLWVEDGGSRRLVILSEEVAKKKKVIASFSKLPEEHR